MKKILYTIFTVAVASLVTSCDLFELDEVNNPNAADAAVVTENATVNQLQALVTGLEFRHRTYLTATKNSFGTFGREVLPYFDSDPRFTTDWLGRAGEPDAGFFGIANTYNAPFQAIAQGNFLMQAAANTQSITDAERNGINGFTKTIQAYQYLVAWLAQWDNGIRIEVSDPLNPGPFLSRTEALAEIRNLLNEGLTDLNGAGASFVFSLSSGFDGFNTPASMAEVNRGLAARAAVYAEDWSGAITALNASFMDLDGDINLGPAHGYGGADGTAANPFNPFFFPLDQFSTQIIVVHPDVLEDIEPGDTRAGKFLMRSPANFVTNQALTAYTATHQDGRFASNTENASFLRNEELILLFAEANAQLQNTTEAVDAINAVRGKAGLDAYAGATTTNALIDQILFERRFSLWHEPIGHRWVDLRRYDRLDELSDAFIVDDENFFLQLARPQGEINFDDFFGG